MSPRAAMGLMRKGSDAWGVIQIPESEAEAEAGFGSKSRKTRSRLFRMMSPALLLVLGSVYVFSYLTGAVPVDVEHGQRDGRQRGHLGAVASEQSICSGIGADMLSAGGNAADAVSRFPTLYD